jgi:FkbM family methyltransferase
MPFSLVEMLGRALARIDVVDVGAQWVENDIRPYDALMKRHAARVVGFEPVRVECDRLNAMGLKDQVYLPYFIGDGTERTFRNCASSQSSSLFEPNMRLRRRFIHLDEVGRVVSTERVKTQRLDDIPEIAAIDFLKVDAQGAEVEIFKGGERLLRGTVAIQTEVCFAPLYEGQPLFAEIDLELRRQGFLFHTFLGMSGRAFKPLAPAPDPSMPIRQFLWGDAVYVKDFTRLGDLTPEQLLKLAAIVHDVYGSPDLAALALQYHEAKTKSGLWTGYMMRLMKAVPPAPPLE